MSEHVIDGSGDDLSDPLTTGSGRENIGSRFSRRRFFGTAGAGIIATGLAACTSDPVPPGTTGPIGTTPTTAATSTGGSGAGGGSGGQGAVDPLRPDALESIAEQWSEPAVWRPKGTEPFTTYVRENRDGLRFSYDGKSPGTTFRMRGDETLYVKIHNELSEDAGKSPIGPNPDPAPGLPGPEGIMFKLAKGAARYGDGLNRIPTELIDDWSLGEHFNGVHSTHVTNMHTHGLHVRPGKNDDGSHSDDIFLRIVPRGDAEKIAGNPELWQKYQENRDEIVGSVADFEFRLGNVMQGLPGPNEAALSGLPHPPGTHWYHPHSHGSTQDQVASGMAGFLIVEGDVDERINETLAGDPNAEWDHKSGDWDYREREFFFQRTFLAPTANLGAGPDPDAGSRRGGNPAAQPKDLINGKEDAHVIVMRPGAIERWRILNGSVDGNGFTRFVVLKGQFITNKSQLQQVDYTNETQSLAPVTVNDHSPLSAGGEDVAKANLWQLAWDGVTLMKQVSGSWSYQVRDLGLVNGGQEPDLASADDCLKGANLPLCYNRPNEVSMAQADRADVFFQAPLPSDPDLPEVYTVVGLPSFLHGRRAESAATSKVLAHVVVRGEPVVGEASYDFTDLLADLEVNPYELPIEDAELAIPESERAARGISGDGEFRTRVLRYAGWGAATFPLIDCNDEYLDRNPDQNKLKYYRPPSPESTDYTIPSADSTESPVPVTNIRRYPDADAELPTILLPPSTRTMSIDGEKFFPTSEQSPRMLLNTAEEWAVYNQSVDTYTVESLPTDESGKSLSLTPEQQKQYVENNPELLWYSYERSDTGETVVGPYYSGHQYSYPLFLADLRAINAERAAAPGEPWEKPGQIKAAAAAVDHPFHIHQNPFWLTRIDVPDEEGNLINVLDEPKWADVAWLPHNGGRVVFRSRFVDYEGEFVNHCHILLHEDNGMMQRVQVVGDPADANYEPSPAVATDAGPVVGPDDPYGAPSLADSWRQSLQFIDANNTGQIYPGEGFTVAVPTVEYPVPEVG